MTYTRAVPSAVQPSRMGNSPSATGRSDVTFPPPTGTVPSERSPSIVGKIAASVEPSGESARTPWPNELTSAT
jgi:hypothetical protein